MDATEVLIPDDVGITGSVLRLEVFIEPGHDAFLDVELMSIFLNAVSLSRINHQLRFHPHVF